MKEQKGYSNGNKERDYKSGAEVQIARLLEKSGIAYRYEQPWAIVDRGKTRIWYPDFYLPEYSVIIEYFGINGNSDYDERTKHKIETYKQNGIEGLFLTDRSLKGDWPARIMGQIEDILKNRLDKFNNRRGENKKACQG